MHFGIDYGSKLAGTTAICFDKDNKLHLLSSKKKENADDFILNQLSLEPAFIMIDAPLSLPAAYFNNGLDYHYRDCDRETKAMSPMFLGGLTARAISLKSKITSIRMIETYPKVLLPLLFESTDFYAKKKNINEEAISKLNAVLSLKLAKEPKNWHEFDAILAWISGERYLNKKSKTFGNKSEGLIIV